MKGSLRDEGDGERWRELVSVRSVSVFGEKVGGSVRACLARDILEVNKSPVGGERQKSLEKAELGGKGGPHTRV